MPRHIDTSKGEDFHWKAFVNFSKYELLAGGPDPHMRLLGPMMRDLFEEGKVWMIGCYMAGYNIPTAEILYNRFSPEYVRTDIEEVERWLRENWKGLYIRRERRPVKSPKRLAQYLYSYAWWMEEEFEKLVKAKDFEEVWDGVGKIRYVGRYAQLKLCETLRRYTGVSLELPDVRAKGGWSPRIGLSYLYPSQAEALNGNDSVFNLQLATGLGVRTQELLRASDINVDMFHVEVLLCDYKQAWHGRQYPGRSNDSELEHYHTVYSYWGDSYDTKMFKARQDIMPGWALGENCGWDGVRKPLTTVLREHGYTWSDSKYDYNATTDFANPVRRS